MLGDEGASDPGFGYNGSPNSDETSAAGRPEKPQFSLSSSKFGWLTPQQVILSVAKDLDGQGDSSLRSE